MKIHEYQGKEILKKYGVPVPEGGVAFSVEEAVSIAEMEWEATKRMFRKLLGS